MPKLEIFNFVTFAIFIPLISYFEAFMSYFASLDIFVTTLEEDFYL
jgi:hypothetical protein